MLRRERVGAFDHPWGVFNLPAQLHGVLLAAAAPAELTARRDLWSGILSQSLIRMLLPVPEPASRLPAQPVRRHAAVLRPSGRDRPAGRAHLGHRHHRPDRPLRTAGRPRRPPDMAVGPHPGTAAAADRRGRAAGGPGSGAAHPGRRRAGRLATRGRPASTCPPDRDGRPARTGGYLRPRLRPAAGPAHRGRRVPPEGVADPLGLITVPAQLIRRGTAAGRPA